MNFILNRLEKLFFYLLMTVTYIYHSCYLLELEFFSVLVDFHQDVCRPDGSWWINDYFLNKKEDVYVLCTHSHNDHFNPEILSWLNRKPNIRYVFSKELLDSKKTSKDDAFYLDKLETYKDENLSVKAFGSTDIGHSFLIETGGKAIFHAGDLNNWHWNEEVAQEEASVYENNYLCELELLAENVEQLFLAMFPLDPRLGKDFMRGAEQFVKRISTDYLLPMHFGENYDKVNEFAWHAKMQNCVYLNVSSRGQSFQL